MADHRPLATLELTDPTITTTITTTKPESEFPKTHSLKSDLRSFTTASIHAFRQCSRWKKLGYVATALGFIVLGIGGAVVSSKVQANLTTLASRMERAGPGAVVVLGLLIALVSVPPLFGHEVLGIVAGYVYGQQVGFLVLTVGSLTGESAVYFGFRKFCRGRLHDFRVRHASNYGIFVAVVEEGGLLMLFLIRMSVIPPHFSTPLFAGLDSITWAKWMLANIMASPVRMFPPVFIGSLLRDSRSNSILGDVAFIFSSLVTFGILWTIRRKYLEKKDAMDLARIRANRNVPMRQNGIPEVDDHVVKDIEEADISTIAVSDGAVFVPKHFLNKDLPHSPKAESAPSAKRPINFSRPVRKADAS